MFAQRLVTRHALALFAGLFATLPTAAFAHDSWLRPTDAAERADGDAQALYLSLTTGNRYPLGEFAVAPASLVQSACRSVESASVPLRAQRVLPRSLLLRAQQGPGEAAALRSCWLEIKAHDIQIEPPLVQVYLNEIRAPQAARAAWATLLASGQPWRERYRKFARMELALTNTESPAQVAALRRPQGLGMEIVPVGSAPLAVGQPLLFQVLRDGKPLPDLSVELVSERNPLGVWQQSDAQGHLRHTLPFGGRWLLRATQLELPRMDEKKPAWKSRFVTLEFEAASR